MAVATKTDHIINTVINYLDDDAALTCVKVWSEKNFKPSLSTTAKVYVWPLLDEYGAIAVERGQTSNVQTMQVGIYCEFAIATIDAQATGTLTAQYSAFSERIEARIAALNSYTRSTGSITDTTTVGSYVVSVLRANIVSRTGLVNNGERMNAGFVMTLRVSYVQDVA